MDRDKCHENKTKILSLLKAFFSAHMFFSTCPFSSNLAAPDTLAVVLSYGFLSSLNYAVVCFKSFGSDTLLSPRSTAASAIVEVA